MNDSITNELWSAAWIERMWRKKSTAELIDFIPRTNGSSVIAEILKERVNG